MTVSLDKLPPVSLLRIEVPKQQVKQVYSLKVEDRPRMLMVIFSHIAEEHKLRNLQAGAEKVGDFHLLIYYLPAKGKSLLAKQLEPLNENVSLTTKAVDYLIFFIRALPGKKVDVFAVTRGKYMHRVVRPFTDFSFPYRVTKRFLSPQIREIKTSHLIGPVLRTSATFYGEPIITQMDLQSQFILQFTTCTRPRFSLQCGMIPHTKEDSFGAEVKMGSIRFNAEFNLRNYVAILEHLSKLYQEEQTFLCPHFSPGEEPIPEEDDENFYFLDLVKKASFKKNEKLDAALFEHLWNVFLRPSCETPLRFWHRYSEDYLRSGTYSLFLSGSMEPHQKWEVPPSIADVLGALRLCLLGKSKEEVISELKKISFGFFCRGEFLKEKLVQFIETEISYEGQVFFKNQGLWLEVSSEYLMIVQRDFRMHIRDCLIGKGAPGALPLEWVSQKKWAMITWSEIEEKIKSYTKGAAQLEEEWGKIKPFTKAQIAPSRKRKAPPSEEPVQRSITSFSSSSSFSPEIPPESLPKPKDSFLVVKAPKGLSPHISQYVTDKFNLQKKVKKEEEYNRLYDDVNTGFYLVGDQITPHGLELFDILHEKDGVLYLYQVKESLQEATTKACSQLRNAAKALSTTLMNPTAASNILEKYWEEATSLDRLKKGSPFHKVSQSFVAYGKEPFLHLFLRDRKAICFVLAFLDTHTNEALLADENREIILKASDLKGLSKTLSEEDIFLILKERKYVNEKGCVSKALLDENQGRFDLGPKVPKKEESLIFHRLYRKITQFRSTLAKVDIGLTRKMIEEMGFTFKMCQIPRPREASITDDEEGESDWSLSFDYPLSSDQTSLSPGDCFSFEDQEYQILRTPPDGSCGLHALLGKPEAEGCRFLEGSPKLVFEGRLREGLIVPEIEEFLVKCQLDLLSNRYSDFPKKEALMAYPENLCAEYKYVMTHPQDMQVKEERLKLLENEKTCWRNLLNAPDSFNVRNKLAMKALYKKIGFSLINEADMDAIMKIIEEERDDLYTKLIKHEEAIKEINDLHRRRMDDTLIEKLRRDFVMRPNVRGHYLKVIQSDNYYFSTQELMLAAKLFGIKARVLSQGLSGMNVADQHEFISGEEEVLIYHHFPDSEHFSRVVIREIE